MPKDYSKCPKCKPGLVTGVYSKDGSKLYGCLKCKTLFGPYFKMLDAKTEWKYFVDNFKKG